MPELKPISRSASSRHMKLLSRRAQPGRHQIKFQKWLLWTVLTVFLFVSTTTTTTSSSSAAADASALIQTLPLRITLSLKNTPRAVGEAPQISSFSPSLKIYVYELPPSFNRGWLMSNARCGSHLFAAEVAVHQALVDFAGRVLDPNEADLFFVPVYVSCNFSTPTGLPSLHHARPLLGSAVRYLSTEFPFWNRSRGRDHIFVASHDFGACFHAVVIPLIYLCYSKLILLP